jgi:hypothetical protein
MTTAGIDLTKPSPSALCRSGFHDEFLTCAKSKCSSKLFNRVQTTLRTACYVVTPKCATACSFPTPEGGLAGLGIPGLSGAGGTPAAGEAGRRARVLAAAPGVKPECGPLDLHCSCSDEYAKWYDGCLRTACDNKEDVQHELMTGLALCATLPPKCTVSQ